MSDQPADIRAEALARFSRTTGIPQLDRITQRGRDPETARFTFHLADSTQIRVGTIKTLWSQSELGKVLAVRLGVIPQPVKPTDWRDMLGVLVAHCIDVEDPAGETFEDNVREWVARYLDGSALDVDQTGAAAQGLPFRENGHLHLSAGQLAKYIRREFSEHVALTELRIALTDLGFERKTVMYTRGKRRSSTSYYRIPADELELPTDTGAAQ